MGSGRNNVFREVEKRKRCELSVMRLGETAQCDLFGSCIRGDNWVLWLIRRDIEVK